MIESAAGVIQNDHHDVLVVAKVYRVGDGIALGWSLPKGEREEGEHLEEAARREIREETGIVRLQLIQALGSYERNGFHDSKDRKRITVFHFATKERRFEAEEKEKHPVAVWVQPSQVAHLLSHPKDQAFFKSILGQLAG